MYNKRGVGKFTYTVEYFKTHFLVLTEPSVWRDITKRALVYQPPASMGWDETSTTYCFTVSQVLTPLIFLTLV